MATTAGDELYRVVGQIGEGAFGLVHYARGPQNRVCAIKTFKTSPKDPPVVPAPTIREVYLLRELKHENVLNLLHVQVNHAELALSLVFDYAEYDLNRVIRHHRDTRRGAPIPGKMVKSIAWQILRGLQYVHAKRVAHRDLKPENILIMGDGVERGLIKIADFGLARKIDTLARPLDENGPVVTLWYRAPELLLGAKHYDEKIDAWAAGAIFGELANLAPLFRGVEEAPHAGARRDMYERSQLEKIFAVLGVPHDVKEKDKDDAFWPELTSHPFWPRVVDAGLTNETPNQKVGFPRRLAENPKHVSLVNLLRKLCRYDPSTRPSAETALTHPYFAETPLPSRNALDPGAEKPETYPQRKIKSAEKFGGGDGAARESEAGESMRGPAPRGAAGAAALNAVRSYGDLRR